MDVSLDAIDACLLELHAAATDLEPTKFREEALGILRAAVPFDGAWWLVGTPSEDVRPHDVVSIGTATGRALPVPGDTACGRVLRHAEAVGAGGPTGTLAFERATADFDADQCRLLGVLARQACALWRLGARAWLLRQLAGGREAAALAGPNGTVYSATGRFHAAVRASWPEWQGGPLPAPLTAAGRGGAVAVVRGLRWSVRESGGSLVISACPLGAFAALTDRERAVVAAVLDAGSQRVAAAQLGVSSYTVRNTLARVYRKLGISGRVQLATRFPPELTAVASCGGGVPRGPG